MTANDDWFEKGCQVDLASVQTTRSEPRYTKATIHKSRLMQELTGARYTLSNPDAREGGTEKHRLLVRYLGLRRTGSSPDDAFVSIATNEAAEQPPHSPRITLWQHGNPNTPRDTMTDVAAAAEAFIAIEGGWKNAKFEHNCQAKILSPSKTLAGHLSYQIDAIVKQFPRGTKCYDFKFTSQPFPPEAAEFEIALMELAFRGGKLNDHQVPKHPGCRLVFPGFTQGQEIDFSGRTHEVKAQIIETCLKLLTAEFESPDNHLNTVRHRVTDRNWKDRKRQKKEDVPAWQIQLF